MSQYLPLLCTKHECDVLLVAAESSATVRSASVLPLTAIVDTLVLTEPDKSLVFGGLAILPLRTLSEYTSSPMLECLTSSNFHPVDVLIQSISNAQSKGYVKDIKLASLSFDCIQSVRNDINYRRACYELLAVDREAP
jgi:hypothetical protein